MIIVFFGFIPVYRVSFRLQFHFYEVSSSFVLNGTSFFDKVILGKRSLSKDTGFLLLFKRNVYVFKRFFIRGVFMKRLRSCVAIFLCLVACLLPGCGNEYRSLSSFS